MLLRQTRRGAGEVRFSSCDRLASQEDELDGRYESVTPEDVAEGWRAVHEASLEYCMHGGTCAQGMACQVRARVRAGVGYGVTAGIGGLRLFSNPPQFDSEIRGRLGKSDAACPSAFNTTLSLKRPGEETAQHWQLLHRTARRQLLTALVRCLH